MSVIQKALWFLLITSHLVILLGAETPCDRGTIRLSVHSCRNRTGQWYSTISLKQGTSQKPETFENETMIFELEQTSTACKSGFSSLDTNILITAPSIKDSSQVVPSGYELFPGVGYYKFHPEVLIWPQARRICASEGGHLIILNSEEENNVAVKIIARHPNAGTWFMTGIQEQGIHKQYFTIFDKPIESTGFTRFYPGQEDAKGPADYGGMHRTGGYSDVNIGEKYAFICEYDLV